VVQLDLDQPPGQQPGGRERHRVQHPDLDQPGLIGQLADHGPQGHRRVRQVSGQVRGSHGGASFDVGFPCLGAGVRLPALPGPGADQQVPHGVGVAGHVRQDMRPGPPRQHRRAPRIGLGDGPGIVQQSLRRLVDLVAQFALRRVHQTTLSQLALRMRSRCWRDHPRTRHINELIFVIVCHYLLLEEVVTHNGPNMARTS
jgi:hypothetical protein